MRKQSAFSDVDYAKRKRKGKRAAFLEKMERIIPWEAIIGVTSPHSVAKKPGRPLRRRGASVLPAQGARSGSAARQI